MSSTQDRTRSVKWQGLALWLLLLSIFTHATVPAGSPLQPVQGSAFSAYTSDVSLAPPRAGLGRPHISPKARDDHFGSGAFQPDLALLAARGAAAPEPPAAHAFASPIDIVALRDAASSPFAPRAPPEA